MGLMLSLGLLPPRLEKHAPSAPALRIEDAAGHNHSFAQMPRRIFFAANLLSPFVTLAMDYSAIKGATKFARKAAKDGLLDKVFTDTATIDVLDDRADIEEVLRLAPDAVFGWPYQTRTFGQDKIFDFVTFLGLPSTESHLRLWRQLGRLSGQDARAESLIDTYRSAMSSVEQHVKTFARTRPSVAILISTSNGIFLGGKRHVLMETIERAGAENPRTAEISGLVSLEDIAALNPDAILISTYFDTLSPEDLFAKPAWQIVNAVRARRVYRVPDLPLFSAPVFDPLLIRWLADTLHPEIARSDLRDRIHRTYQDIYHYNLSEADIDTLLALSENKGTSGYARFEANSPEAPMR